MPIARITSIGGDLYHVHVMEGGEHPSHGLPGGGGRPDQGLPGGGGLHPGNRPPGSGPGRPVDPGYGQGGMERPGQGLPSNPNFPDNTLPETPPPQLLPGYTLVMVRGPDGKWKYAAVAPGTPVQPLPEPIPPGGRPDQGLPPQQPGAGGPPPMPGQPLPPTAAPKPV